MSENPIEGGSRTTKILLDVHGLTAAASQGRGLWICGLFGDPQSLDAVPVPTTQSIKTGSCKAARLQLSHVCQKEKREVVPPV